MTILRTYTATAPTAPSSATDSLTVEERVELELATTLDARVRQLRALWDEQSDVRRTIAELEQYATGDQLSTAPMMPQETVDHWRAKPEFAPNFLGTAIDKLSGLYTTSPLRDVANATTWRRILWTELDRAMRRQDGLAHLTGTRLVVVEPAWDDDRTQREAMAQQQADEPTRLCPRFFGPDRFAAVADEYDQQRIAALAVHWQTLESTDGVRYAVHYYWDDTTFAVLRDWVVVWSAPHGLGAVPAATLPNTDEPGIYGRNTGGKDLVRCCRALVGYTREVLHTARLQRGQPYSKGKTSGALGPDSKIEVDIAGDFGFAANSADLPGMLDTLERVLSAFALGLGLPRGTFQLTGTLDLAADHTELARQRQNRAPLARRWESEIHRVAALVWQRWTGRTLNVRELHVTYTEEPPPMTVADRLALAQFGLQNGLRDEFDTARSLWPHMSEPEIRAMVERGMDAQARRMGQQAVVAGHARDVDGGVGDPNNGTINRGDDGSSGSVPADPGSAGPDEPEPDASPAG